MKPGKWLYTMFFCVMFIPVGGFAEDKSADTAPVAFLPENVYTFEPVVEGTEVIHHFLLQNKGDATLVIDKLESG